MTEFLIKSATSMALLLAIYHLFLEREKMHRFNRFYLLFALAFSLALPFITFTIYKEVHAMKMPVFNEEVQVLATAIEMQEPTDYITPLFWFVYAAITLLLAVKFAKNVRHFTKQARKNRSEKLENATLVLLDEKVTPHTFLNYIFVSKDEYEQNGIEQELYTHELAHVRQRHSLDILFIEVLKTVLWFNPLLYFYKKAIQLNHEFLADETVVSHSNNIIDYQKLLLQKAMPATAYQLASSLNFSVTKKRFKMMTKATPKRKALLLKLAALPVIAGLIFALCTETVAQTAVTEELEIEAIAVEMPDNNGKADPKRDSYYAGVKVVVLNDKGEKVINKPYENLTEAEKDTYMTPVPEPAQKRKLSAKLFESLKDSKTYKVAIDNVPVDNSELDKYKAEDFAVYTNSPAFTDALTGKPALSQYMLYTNNYFDTKVKNSHKKFSGNTYTVATGSYVKTTELQPDAPVKRENITPEMYAEYLEFIKAKGIARDTVKKTREQKLASLHARKKQMLAERSNAMNQREEIIASRNSEKAKKNGALDGKRAEIDKKRASMDSIKAETGQFKAIMAQRLHPKNANVNQEDKIYKNDEVTAKPDYPGGMMEFYRFVNSNFKIAKELKGSVRIYVSFIVEKDGSISNITILKDPGHGAGDEAVRVLKESKKWIPANIDGKPVRYNFNLPIAINVK